MTINVCHTIKVYNEGFFLSQNSSQSALATHGKCVMVYLFAESLSSAWIFLFSSCFALVGMSLGCNLWTVGMQPPGHGSAQVRVSYENGGHNHCPDIVLNGCDQLWWPCWSHAQWNQAACVGLL